MADNSSERKTNSNSEGGPLSSNIQLTMTTLPSHQRRRQSEDGQKAAHHHHHLQVDQSHPAKELQDVNITRTRNADAILPLSVHQFRLLQADLHHRLLSTCHLDEDFKSQLRKKSFSIVYQVKWRNTAFFL